MINGKFYYQVTDDGMIGDQIIIGDIVLIDSHIEVYPNDIVAIALESKLIFRRIEMIGSKYMTKPSNPVLLPEILENAIIIGKVINHMIPL